MIKSARIFGIMLRHIIPTFRDPIRLCDMFYWPLVDILLFGFMATWAQEQITDKAFMLPLITCIACWYLVQRSALEIARNFLMEQWDKHLINLFATPISLTELMIALMLLGVLQALVTFCYSMCAIWFIYAQNIFALLGSLMPFMLLLIMCGWIIGFLVASLILFFGKNVDTLIWAVIWFFAIISGAFYPVKLFPTWIQKMSFLFPATYLFEGIREMIITKSTSWYNLSMGFALVIVYFIASWTLMHTVFQISKDSGLSKLE